MKSLIVVFGVILLVIALPFIFDAVDGAVTDNITNTFASITTAAGVTAANVTLGQDSWNDAVSGVSAVSSNISADSPTPYTYNSVAHSLEVSGLAAGQTRTLTVAYLVENGNLPSGMTTILTVLRWFFVFIILGLAIGAVYAFFD